MYFQENLPRHVSRPRTAHWTWTAGRATCCTSPGRSTATARPGSAAWWRTRCPRRAAKVASWRSRVPTTTVKGVRSAASTCPRGTTEWPCWAVAKEATTSRWNTLVLQVSSIVVYRAHGCVVCLSVGCLHTHRYYTQDCGIHNKLSWT